jgi:hypothetical protein
VGDFNHDGLTDVAVVSKRGDLVVFNGPDPTDGNASFTAKLNRNDCIFLKDGVLLAGPWASDFLVTLEWDGKRYSLHP